MPGDAERGELRRSLEEFKVAVSTDKALTQAVRQYPGLAWIKRYDPDSNRYIMMELSDQYVLRILGGKREDYVGKTDFDVWDYEEAIVFFENDEETRTGRRNPTERLSEPWVSSRTGQKGTFTGRKYRFDSEGVTYIAGFE